MDASSIPSAWAGDISGQATAAAIACLVIEVLVLTIRGLAKPVTKARTGWDDWLLIPAGFFNLALCGLTLYDTHNDGLGQHETAVWLENPNNLTTFAKTQLLWSSIYACCCCFPKLVLLVLYLRIFTKRSARITSFILMGIVVFYTILAIIIIQLMCIPISALWDPTDTTAKCINLPAWFAYSTVPSVVIDAFVIALPIPSLIRLKLPLRDRIGLVFTFTAGGIGTAAGIARTVMYRYINGATDDVTWSGVPLAIVGLVECMLYLLAAALPGLRPLYLFLRGRGQYSSPKPSYLVDSSEGSSERRGTRMLGTATAIDRSHTTLATTPGSEERGLEYPQALHAQGPNPAGQYPHGIVVAQSYTVR